MDLEGLGKRVQAMRKAAGLSVQAAAKAAGIKRNYWYSLEKAAPNSRTGLPVQPQVPVVRAIADAVGGDRAELLELAGHPGDAVVDRDRLDGLPYRLSELRRLDLAAYTTILQMTQAALVHAQALSHRRKQLLSPLDIADPQEMARLLDGARELLQTVDREDHPTGRPREVPST